MGVLRFDEILKRHVRAGDWEDQLVSTFRKICEAIQAGRRQEAVEYIDFFVVEGKVSYDLYQAWVPLLHQCLKDLGMEPADVEEVDLDLRRLVNRTVGVLFDPEQDWQRLQSARDGLVAGLGGPAEASLERAAAFKELWRTIHDRYVDLVGGLFNAIATNFGEESVAKAYYDYISGPHFEWRYRRFNPNVASWQEMLPTNIYLSIESMRGHLCGPKREGDMELTEEADRWVVSFDPCGSGGRLQRGDQIESTPPRAEPPYNWSVTQEEHDWAWNMKGVCHYCAHCCIVLEKLPIEHWGYPVRVVDPPTYPDRKEAKCRWYIYKDLDDIPEEYYLRVGAAKPPRRGD